MFSVQSNLYQFQRRQIALMARVTPYAMAGHIANTTVIAIALAGSVRPPPLIIWCAYSYATAVFLLYRHVRNRGRWPRSFQRAAKRATIYAFLLALPWSSLAVLYLGSLSHGEELLLVALGAGMAACGTVLLSAIPSAAFSYMSVVLLPSAMKYFVVGQKGYLLLGALALSYWGCLAALIAKTSRDNRERQESELVLAERNAQIALAGTAALVGSYSYDVHNGKMQVSEGYAAIHGLPEGTTETTRGEWQDRVHPDDVGRLEGLRCHAFQERGHEYNVEYRIVLPDRGVRWIESRSFISYDGDGNAQRVIGINIDITERKRTELALQASEAKFAGILAIAGDAIVSIDANHRITLFNRAAERVYGYSQAEMLGQPIKLLIPTRFHAEHQRQIGRFAAGPDIARRVGERQEVVGLRKNGEEFPAEASVSMLDVGDERYYTVVMRDISDRKRSELALAERNTQLELASKSARVGSFSVDFSTGIVKLTPGCAAIYGLPEGTIEASSDELRKLVHPEDLPELEALRDQTFLAQRREFIAQSRIVRADDGEVRWLEMRSLIFYHQAGKPSHLIGVNIDVTERKRAEERQCVLVAELDHRVKNVLANVCAVVSNTWQESTSVADFVSALEGRIRSLATAHELLSSGGWQGISLTELVRRELAPYTTRYNTKISGPEIVLRPEAGQVMAMVLHELATNAAKYGALSTKAGSVSIRWHRRMNGHPRPSLVLEWQEMGGPPVVATGKPSYGTSTIGDLIPYEFGGTVDLVLAPDGVRCHLELPSDWFNHDGELVSSSITHANNSQEISALKQVALKALRRDAKSYCNETRGPPPDPIASTRLRVRRRRTRAFGKKISDRPETMRRVPKAPSGESREQIESALRAVDSHIVKGEHCLLAHGKLMEKLNDESNLILAHQLRQSFETGLRVMRSNRVRLMKELQQFLEPPETESKNCLSAKVLASYTLQLPTRAAS